MELDQIKRTFACSSGQTVYCFADLPILVLAEVRTHFPDARRITEDEILSWCEYAIGE